MTTKTKLKWILPGVAALAALGLGAGLLRRAPASPAPAQAGDAAFAFCQATEGEVLTYDLVYDDQSELAADRFVAAAAPAVPFTTHLEGDLVLTCGPRGDSVRLAVLPRGFAMGRSGLATALGEPDRQALAQGLVVRYDAQGRLEALTDLGESLGLPQTLLVVVATKLQLSVRADETTATWTAREVDTNGAYRATYQQEPADGGLALVKVKNAYESAPGTAPREVVGTRVTAKVTGEAVAETAGREELRSVQDGRQIYRAETDWRLTLKTRAPLAAEARAALKKAADGGKRVAWQAGAWQTLTTRQAAQSSYRSAVDGHTDDEIITAAASLAPGAKDAEAYQRLKALLALRPEALRPHLAELAAAPLDDPLLRLATIALGALGDPASQALLRTIVTDRLQAGRAVELLVPLLGQTAQATDETLALLASLGKSPDGGLASTATLALGRALRSAASPDAVARLQDLLSPVARLGDGAPPSPETTLALKALGNAGRVESLAPLVKVAQREDLALDVRVEAVQALRFVPDATDALAQDLEPGRPEPLRRAALEALGQQPAVAAVLDRAAALVTDAGEPEALRLAALDLLWKHVHDDQRAATWLTVAAHDNESAAVRRKAAEYAEVLGRKGA